MGMTPRPLRGPRIASAGPEVLRAWMHGRSSASLSFFGNPQVKAFLDGLSSLKVPVPLVHQLIERMPP